MRAQLIVKMCNVYVFLMVFELCAAVALQYDMYTLPTCKLVMVNGSQYHRALESVSISSALSSALTIYPCQIRVYQRWQSKLQLLTARKKEWWPATADSLPLSTVIHTMLAGIEPTTFRLLVRPLPVELPRPPNRSVTGCQSVKSSYRLARLISEKIC